MSNGSEELVHWLMDQGADPLTPTQPREAFHGAVICQQVSVLKRMLAAEAGDIEQVRGFLHRELVLRGS